MTVSDRTWRMEETSADPRVWGILRRVLRGGQGQCRKQGRGAVTHCKWGMPNRFPDSNPGCEERLKGRFSIPGLGN